MPEFIPDDSAVDDGFEVVEEQGAPLYEVVVEETPVAPDVPMQRVTTRQRRQQPKPGGAFGEWLRGQGLWILDAVGVALMVVGTLATRGAAPANADAAYKVGFVLGLICAFVIFLPLALALGAVLLRLACRLGKVEAPEFARCIGIVCLVGSVQWLINQVIGLFVNVGDPQHTSAGSIIAAIVLNFAVGAAASIPVLNLTLAVSLGRAALIWLIEIVLVIALVTVLVLAIFGIALVVGLS